jgi:hypothetical protein
VPKEADLDALRASMGTISNINNANLERSFNAAKLWVTDRVMASKLNDPETQEAILLLAGRLYKRRQSPEGVSGWGELGVIRILANDPDIERLLERKYDYAYLKAGLA